MMNNDPNSVFLRMLFFDLRYPLTYLIIQIRDLNFKFFIEEPVLRCKMSEKGANLTISVTSLRECKN